MRRFIDFLVWISCFVRFKNHDFLLKDISCEYAKKRTEILKSSYGEFLVSMRDYESKRAPLLYHASMSKQTVSEIDDVGYVGDARRELLLRDAEKFRSQASAIWRPRYQIPKESIEKVQKQLKGEELEKIAQEGRVLLITKKREYGQCSAKYRNVPYVFSERRIVVYMGRAFLIQVTTEIEEESGAGYYGKMFDWGTTSIKQMTNKELLAIVNMSREAA